MTEALTLSARPPVERQPSEVFDHPYIKAMRDSRQAMTLTDPNLPDCPLVYVNAAFSEMTGYRSNEVLGRNCRFLQGPGTDPAAVRRIRDALARQEAACVDILNYRKDGTPFWNQLVLSPLYGADGRVLYYFGSQLDITERRTAEAALAQQLDLQRAVVRDMNHRVANSFSLVLAMMSLQRGALSDAASRQMLDMLEGRVRACAEVHHALHRGPGDCLEIAADAFLARLVDGVREGMAGCADGSRLTADLDVTPERLPADHAIQLGIIVAELVTNAAKYAGRGGLPPHVSITLRPSVDGRRLHLRVCDDGPGLPAIPKPETGSGLEIIEVMARQLGATVVSGSTGAGAWAELTFPRPQPAGPHAP